MYKNNINLKNIQMFDTNINFLFVLFRLFLKIFNLTVLSNDIQVQ